MPTVPMTSREIADDLTARIARREYAPGDKLPSYAEIAALYSVGISTARTAILLLRDRELVVGVKGRGVYVKEDQ